jgi:hypothetical protein
MGVIYVDSELKPTPPSARRILGQAAAVPSLSDYVQKMGWMNPIYANLRLALAEPLYLNPQQRICFALNLERRARAAVRQRPLRHRQRSRRAALHV